MNRSRLVLPFVLVLAGAFLLVGCIFIPSFNKVVRGVDASEKVGDAKSRKPLRIGHAMRADVERVLGPPQYASADGSEVGYTWVIQRGVWMSLCFGSEKVTGMRTLVLKFDGDVLQGFGAGINPSRLQPRIRDNSAATTPAGLPSPQPQTQSSTATPPGPTYQTKPSP